MSRRSRSRSPVLRGPRKVEVKAAPVNMLDMAAIKSSTGNREERKRISFDGNRGRERITCTIAGQSRERGPVSNRLSGYGYRDQQGNGNNNRSNYRREGFQNRSFDKRGVRDRLSFGDNRTEQRKRRSEGDSEVKRNGSFRNEDKPVQRLIDPTSVPKSKAYFDHDDRGGDGDKWRGRSSYDPRIDFGPRRNRFQNNRRRDEGWSGFGHRDRYDNRDQRDNRRDSRDFRPYRAAPSKADSVWTHDKYEELEAEKEGVEVIVDDSNTSRRNVETDDKPGRHSSRESNDGSPDSRRDD